MSSLITISSKYKIMKQNYNKLKSHAIDTEESLKEPTRSQMKQSDLVKSLMSEIQEKTELLTMKTNELNDTKILLNQIKNQLSIEQSKTKYLNDDVNTYKARLSLASERISEEKRKRREIAKTATGALSDSAQSTLTYEQMIDKLQNENDVLYHTKENQQMEIQKLKDKINKQNCEIKQLKEDKEKMVKELQNIREINDQEKNKVMELTRKADDLNQSLIHSRKLLESKIALIESEKAEKAFQFEERAKSLTQQNIQLQNRVTFAESKLNEYKDQISTLSQIGEQQQTKFESFQKSLKEFRMQKDAITTILNDTKSELENEKITKNNLTIKNEALQKEIEKSHKEFNDISEMLSTVNNKCNEQTKQINQLVEQNYVLRQIFQGIPKRFEILTKRIWKYRDEIFSKIETIEKNIKDKNIEHENIQENNEMLIKQVNEVKKSLQKSVADKNEIKNEVENVMQTICYLTGTEMPHDGDIHAKLRQLAQATEKMADEITQSRASLAHFDAMNECRGNFEAERTRLYEGISTLRSALKMTKKSLIQSEAENAQLRKEIAEVSPDKRKSSLV